LPFGRSECAPSAAARQDGLDHVGPIGPATAWCERAAATAAASPFDDGSRLLCVEAVTDDFEGQEVLTLLAQHPAQPLDVVFVELAVAEAERCGFTSPWLSRNRIFEMVMSGNSWRKRLSTSPMER